MRYELSDYEWTAIKPMLPNKPRGVRRVNDRRVLNGIFWVLRSGAPWRDLPENYGPRTTCYNRFVRWRRAGVWDQIMDALAAGHDAAVQMIDTSVVRVHQHGACVADNNQQDMGRSRGGLTSKIHAVVDTNGLPVHLALTPGEAHDNRLCSALLSALPPQTMLLADRGYDADWIRELARRQGAWANIGDYPGLDLLDSPRYIPSTLRGYPMAKRPKPVHQMTASQFEARFYSEEACQTYLIARRWPNGVHCPRCGNTEITALDSGFHWQCYECAPDTSYRFSGIAGTIFENTNKPLYDWFKVTHLMLTSKKGVSALQIMRFMGFGSYKTAWGMCHKIRAALIEPETKLGGIVEVDETWIGGKDKNKHKSKRGKPGMPGKHAPSTKTPVIGAVSRKGNVIARVLDSVTKDVCQSFVREMVSNKVSLLASDEHRGYASLHEYKHKSVMHSARQYVCGSVHTQTIEGFWSIMKRGIVGSYHKVSKKYLPLYVAEFQFRYNNRFNEDIFGTAIEGC